MKMIYLGAAATLVIGNMVLGTASAGPFNGIHPLQSDRFSFAIGGFFSDTDGHYELDDPDGDDGSNVDLDEIGLGDSSTLPAAGFNWRLSNSTRIQAEYFNVGQDTSETLDEQIDWGDLEFEIGTRVRTDMDVDIARAFYGYSFIKDQKKEFGAGVGLHYLNLDVSIKGNATIDGEPVLDVKQGINDSAILPNVGAYANYAISPKWLVLGRVDWISASIGDWDGELWNFEAAVQYQAFRNFGVGLAYRYLSFDLSVDDGDGDWDADIQYNGPLLFFTANF